MDKFVYLLLTFIIICGNADTVRTQDTTYFEGEIQYTVSYQSLDPGIPNSYFYENYGDSSVVFIKEDIYLVWKNSAGPDGDEVSNLPLYKSVSQATMIRVRMIRDEELKLDPSKTIVDANW